MIEKLEEENSAQLAKFRDYALIVFVILWLGLIVFHNVKQLYAEPEKVDQKVIRDGGLKEI